MRAVGHGCALPREAKMAFTAARTTTACATG